MDKTFFARIPPVSRLPDEDIDALITCAAKRNLKKGDIALQEGTICRSIYFVEQGFLRTYYNKDGKEINLNFTFERAFITNMKSIKSKQPSEITIDAGEDSIVWVFNLDMIAEKAKAHPQLVTFTRRLAISILLASEAHNDLLKMLTPAERYNYVEQNNPHLLQRISLSQMASYLGVARETISRIRAKRHSA